MKVDRPLPTSLPSDVGAALAARSRLTHHSKVSWIPASAGMTAGKGTPGSPAHQRHPDEGRDPNTRRASQEPVVGACAWMREETEMQSAPRGRGMPERVT